MAKWHTNNHEIRLLAIADHLPGRIEVNGLGAFFDAFLLDLKANYGKKSVINEDEWVRISDAITMSALRRHTASGNQGLPTLSYMRKAAHYWFENHPTQRPDVAKEPQHYYSEGFEKYVMKSRQFSAKAAKIILAGIHKKRINAATEQYENALMNEALCSYILRLYQKGEYETLNTCRVPYTTMRCVAEKAVRNKNCKAWLRGGITGESTRWEKTVQNTTWAILSLKNEPSLFRSLFRQLEKGAFLRGNINYIFAGLSLFSPEDFRSLYTRYFLSCIEEDDYPDTARYDNTPRKEQAAFQMGNVSDLLPFDRGYVLPNDDIERLVSKLEKASDHNVGLRRTICSQLLKLPTYDDRGINLVLDTLLQENDQPNAYFAFKHINKGLSIHNGGMATKCRLEKMKGIAALWPQNKFMGAVVSRVEKVLRESWRIPE